MRNLFIFGVIVLVVLYFGQVSRNYTMIQVPDYQEEEVDLLGGKSRKKWDENPTYQAERLAFLQEQHYQPPLEGIRLSDGRVLPPDRPLTAKDFEAIIADQPGIAVRIRLRNPSAIREVVASHCVLRDPLRFTTKHGEEVAYEGGEIVTHEMIDKILDAAPTIPRISVLRNGKVVGVEFPTIVMVWLIFLALVSALKTVLWEPILAILDRRRDELEQASRLTIQNRTEAKKFETDRHRLYAEARRAYLDRLAKVQAEARREADGILKETHKILRREEEHTMAALEKELALAECELRKEIPNLARFIAETLLGRTLSQTSKDGCR